MPTQGMAPVSMPLASSEEDRRRLLKAAREVKAKFITRFSRLSTLSDDELRAIASLKIPKAVKGGFAGNTNNVSSTAYSRGGGYRSEAQEGQRGAYSAGRFGASALGRLHAHTRGYTLPRAG